MKILKIPNLDNAEIKTKEYNKPKFNAPIFQPYCRVSLSGSSGTGKSNAFINLYEKMYPSLDKTFVVSATIHNDPKQAQAFVGRDNVMVFDNPSVELFKEIIDMIDEINKQHKDFLAFMKVYKKWIENNMEEMCLRPAELVLLYKYDFDPSKLPYNKEMRPNICVFLDDLQGLDLVSGNGKGGQIFNNFIIKARHKSCNVFLTSQTWKGVSPVWRRNCSGYLIFKTIDMNQLKAIFEEIQGLFKSYDEFLEYYNFATDEKHNFLYIDTNDKKAPIRKNFNLVIKPN